MKSLEEYSELQLTNEEMNEITGGTLHMYQDADYTIFYEFDPRGNVRGSVWAWHA